MGFSKNTKRFIVHSLGCIMVAVGAFTDGGLVMCGASFMILAQLAFDTEDR